MFSSRKDLFLHAIEDYLRKSAYLIDFVKNIWYIL